MLVPAAYHLQSGGVAIDDSSFLWIKNLNGVRTGFEEFAKFLLALAQRGFGALALGNVARNHHMQSPTTCVDRGQQHFQRNFASIEAPGHPFEPVTAVLFNQGYYLRGLFAARGAV